MKALILLLITSLFCACQSNKSIVNTSSSNLTEEQLFNITAQPKDFPLVFRRTTLIVRDIHKSLELYRDIMGMEVIYDNELTRPRKDGKEGTQQLKLVFLKATHEFYGVLGLLEYNYGETIEEKEIRKEGLSAQNVVLLFNSKRAEQNFAKIKQLQSIEVIDEPHLVEYPSANGKDKIRVMVSMFYDPDGFLVEYNQLLDSL